MPFPNLYRCNKVLVDQKKNTRLHAPADHAQHVAAGEDHVDEGLAAGNGDYVVPLENARRPELPE
jgi:hypothetical protein